MWLHLSQYTMRRGSPPEIFYSPTYRCDWNRRTPRASFQYKDNLSMYRNSYYKDKTIVKLSPLIIPLLATRCLYIEMTPLSFTGNTSRTIDVIISSKWRIAYSANLLPNCILWCFDMRCHRGTEIEMSPFWWNFRHWLPWKFSGLSVKKIPSKWKHLRFSGRNLHHNFHWGITNVSALIWHTGCVVWLAVCNCQNYC